MTSVTQEWTWELSRMQQTVLLTAIRGPDGLPKYGAVKQLLRWYRRCTLISSLDNKVLNTPYSYDGGSFMGPSYEPTSLVHDWRPLMHDIVSEYIRDLDAIPHHFQLHFLHAAEIVGYKHPNAAIREWWHSVYIRLVHDMHLYPETEEQLDRRLGDNRDQWLERADPATVD